MQLYSKVFEVKISQNQGILKQLEYFFRKSLAPDEKVLRYFIFSTKPKSLKVEATILRE